MDSDLLSPPEPNFTALLRGIVGDAQDLIRQQLVLFRQEVRDDLQKTRDAALALAVGVGVALVGGVLLLIMLPLLLNWLIPELPLWACFGLVGALFAALGATLVYAGVRRFKSIKVDQSAAALKENFRWTIHPR